jgi:hypothetical protein
MTQLARVGMICGNVVEDTSMATHSNPSQLVTTHGAPAMAARSTIDKVSSIGFHPHLPNTTERRK